MDQAERLRHLAASTKARARTIAVTSGKGGVGKTSLSVNLALELARLGKKVIVVDVDIGLANADVLCSVQPRYHLGNVVRGEVRAAEALTPVASGVSLLAGSSALPAVSDLGDRELLFLVDSFRELEELAGVVIIDTGAGITRNVIQFAAAAREVLVVTTPEPTAITDAYALIKTLTREKGARRVRLVVNQVVSVREAARVSEKIRLVSRRFLDLEVDDLGHVQIDCRVSLAVRKKRPFVLEYPECAASICIRSLAAKLLAQEKSAVEGFALPLAAGRGTA